MNDDPFILMATGLADDDYTPILSSVPLRSYKEGDPRWSAGPSNAGTSPLARLPALACLPGCRRWLVFMEWA